MPVTFTGLEYFGNKEARVLDNAMPYASDNARNGRLPLPCAIEDITAAWLTQALDDNFPGAVVTAVSLGGVLSGTATKVRLLLSYNEQGHAYRLPPTMWLKGGFIQHEHTYREWFVKEATFFDRWAKHLDINIPRCFYSGSDPSIPQGLVLLEDLGARNATMGYAPHPISVDHQAATLELLAKIHAKWWNSPALADLESTEARWSGADQIVMRMLEPDYYNSCLSKPQGQNITGAYKDPQRVAAAVKANWRAGSLGPQCFSHGDAHLGNMFFDIDGSPGLLDWQGYERGTYGFDLSYSIIGNITVEDRRSNEKDLIKHYLACLGQLGVSRIPTFDEAWQIYRCNVMHGFMWFATPLEMQPEAIIEASGSRFGIAAVDLDSFGALGV